MIAEEHALRKVDNLEVTLLVHDYSRPEGSQQRPKQQVLSEGFRLVAAGSFVTRPLGQQVDFGKADEKKRVNSFTYSKKPPILSVARTIPVVKEWGSSISSDEMFTIGDLEEFRMTEAAGIDEIYQRSQDIDTASLHEIIPQPHLYPSCFLLTIPPPKGKPFSRNKPTFVAPYSNFSFEDHIRVAWLIPIRGVLPWSGCTSASLLNVRPSSAEDNLISWNRASLLQFWQFLLDLQKSGSLGAIGVSLHPARLSKSNSDDRRRVVITNPASTDLSPRPMEHRCCCSTVDYFKVYHDASRTFYMRRALDSWSYQIETDIKVRVLKGAKLPLLDDISNAILIC